MHTSLLRTWACAPWDCSPVTATASPVLGQDGSIGAVCAIITAQRCRIILNSLWKSCLGKERYQKCVVNSELPLPSLQGCFSEFSAQKVSRAVRAQHL